MTSEQLIHQLPNLTSSHRRLILFSSISLLPIFALARLRWISRFGLDSLHIVLLQLVFSLFLTQRLNSKTVDTILKSMKENGNNRKSPQTNEKPASTSKDLSSSAGIARSLKGLIDQSTDWINVFPTPGLEILKHRSIKSVYAVRTEVEDDSLSLQQLVRYIRESKQWEWDRMCECGEDLGDGLTWIRLKGFWPIKPKELVMQSCIFKLPSTDSLKPAANENRSQPPIRILVASTSTNHPRKNSTLEIKFAGYLIEQLSSSSPIRITQIVDLSGFGPIPTFVTKAILTKFIPSSLRKLIALAQRLSPLSPPSDPSGEESSPSWIPPLLNDTITCNSPSGLERTDEEDRLKQMIEQLKKMIIDLQLEHYRSGKSNQSDQHGWFKSSSKALSAVLGTGFTLCCSFILLKNRRFLASKMSNRKKVQTLDKSFISDDLILLLELILPNDYK